MITSSKNEIADVVICGAGIAGSSLALHLASRGLRVVILHREDARRGIETISPSASQTLGKEFANLGIPFSRIAAWWGSENISTQSVPGARAVSRQQMANALRVAASNAAKTFTVKLIRSTTWSKSKWTVCWQDSHGDPHRVQAELLCDATGRRRLVGQKLGASCINTDRLCCVSTFLEQESRPGTWTEAVSNGWWNYCSDGRNGTLSFYSTPNHVRAARAGFMQSLSQTTEMCQLISSRTTGHLVISACNSSIQNPCAGPNWFSVGDATMTLQPLASSGISRALLAAKDASFLLNSNSGEYNDKCITNFRQYLQALSAQYALESRWANSAFWSEFKQDRIAAKSTRL